MPEMSPYPTVENITPVTPPPTLTLQPPRTAAKKIIFAFLALTVIAVGLFIRSRYFPAKILPGVNSSPTPENSTLPTTTLTPIPQASQYLAYLKDLNPENVGDEEVWLINPNDNKEQKLPLANVSQVYKHYDSSFLFYYQANDIGEYHVLDLATGVDTTYDLLDHSDPSAIISLVVSDINQVSPDGKYLVFNADFFTTCPSPSPFPSGFQGGFGPCQPDISLTTPPGYYYYDFASRQATYIGQTIRIPRWDTQANKLFVVDYDNGNDTKAINLASKTTVYVDATQYFGYFLYPLTHSDQMIKLEGNAGNDGEPAFSSIYLADHNGILLKPIDKSDSWTGIQPFVSVSPDEKSILYIRTTNISGFQQYSIYLYDLITGQSKKLTQDNNNLSYSIYVTWLDNDNFVTRVDPIETGHYNAANQYLVKINLKTGVETQLTPHQQVRTFNSQ